MHAAFASIGPIISLDENSTKPISKRAKTQKTEFPKVKNEKEKRERERGGNKGRRSGDEPTAGQDLRKRE